MILLISTCSEKFNELEFVRPLKDIVGKCKVVHFTKINQSHIKSASKIIICGTALKDFEYLKVGWDWIKNCDKPILGICAGVHAIAKAFDWELIEETHIGVYEVKTILNNPLCENNFNAYFLHTKNVKGDFKTLAKVKSVPAIIKHHSKPFFGCIFHSEVMNKKVLQNFLEL